MTTPARRATSAEDALALAQRAGIHRIPLPTPFMVGRVNCYLIEDEPLTLIDTGPNLLVQLGQAAERERDGVAVFEAV